MNIPFDRGAILAVFVALLCSATILITYALKKTGSLRCPALTVHLWHSVLMYVFLAALMLDLWSSFGQDPTGNQRVATLILFTVLVIATNFACNYVFNGK